MSKCSCGWHNRVRRLQHNDDLNDAESQLDEWDEQMAADAEAGLWDEMYKRARESYNKTPRELSDVLDEWDKEMIEAYESGALDELLEQAHKEDAEGKTEEFK